jgi:hypothetical protein
MEKLREVLKHEAGGRYTKLRDVRFDKAWPIRKYRLKTVPPYDARVPFLPHYKGA